MPVSRRFLGAARGIWKRWLSRRGRDKPLSWPEFVRLEQHYRLPPARVVHGLLAAQRSPEMRNRMH